jgi:hypothetical protein
MERVHSYKFISCAFFESSASASSNNSYTGNPALTINKTGTGNGIYLEKNSQQYNMNLLGRRLNNILLE